MNVFMHSMVEGCNARLMDAGMVAWPNEKVASEVCASIANDLSGPEALPAGGLSEKSALAIMQALKTASDRLIAAGHGPTAASLQHAKVAAAMDLSERAAHVALACMDKAASEASLTNVDKNTPESAAKHDQHAELDQHNRSEGEYLVGVGNSAMPKGGVVGKEIEPTKTPANKPAISNSVTPKAAALAAFALGKVANEDMEAADLMGLGQGGQGQGGQGQPPQGQPPQGQPPQGMGGQGQGPQEGEGPALDPKMVQQLLMMLSQCQEQGGQPPSEDAGMAMGGLAQHPQGMNVMAHILETSKTAAEIEFALGRVLDHQEKTASTASRPMRNAVRAALAAPIKTASKRTEAKSDSFLDLLKQGAEGSLTDVAKNTPEDAAKHDQHAELDLKNRPADKYNKGVKGVGKSDMPSGKQLEAIVKDPVKGHENVSVDTVPSRETKSAALAADETEYLETFQKAAVAYGPLLPTVMPHSEKVAHIKALLGRSPSEREAYLAQFSA